MKNNNKTENRTVQNSTSEWDENSYDFNHSEYLDTFKPFKERSGY